MRPLTESYTCRRALSIKNHFRFSAPFNLTVKFHTFRVTASPRMRTQGVSALCERLQKKPTIALLSASFRPTAAQRPAPLPERSRPTPRFPGTGHSAMIWLHERLWNAQLQRSLYPVIDGLRLGNRGLGEFTSSGHYHHRRFSDDVRFRGLLGFSQGFQGHEGLFSGRQYPALVCARCIQRVRDVRYRRHHVAGLSALHLRSQERLDSLAVAGL